MPKIKLLFDEDIGKKTAELVRAEGYDVVSIIEEMPGLPDQGVLSYALKEKRVLVTLDRDFGRLVYLSSQKHCGVLYLRLKNESAPNIAQTIIKTIKSRGKIMPKHFVTATESVVRIRS